MKNKTLKVILIVLLALVLCVGIFYLAAPRTAMQLVMSDTNYAKYVVSKNALKAYNNTDALKFDGRLSGELGEIEFLDDEESKLAANKYLKTILVSGNLHKGKEAAKLNLALSDRDGALLTSEAIISEDLNCFKINELNTGWLKLEKEKAKPSTAAKAATNKAPGVELEKLIKVSKDKIEIKATTTQLKNGIISDFLPDEYKALFDNAIKTMAAKLASNGIENVAIEFIVDNRNRITDMDMSLEGADNNIEFVIAFGDESEGKLTYNDLTFDFVVKETDVQSFDIPSKMEVSTFDEETLKSDLIKYLFSGELSNHSDLSELYSAIFGSKIKSGIGALLEGFIDTDDLSEGIMGIIDGAMNKDSSGVGDIVSNFFEAFGLVGD
ncbi:MAG: hypothetical protein KBS82_06115 [Oscillospiraceae bacterium]|nr:hypothetical protein [Candidatus Limimonas egerieequi]